MVGLDLSAVLNTTAAALLAYVGHQLVQHAKAIAVLQKSDTHKETAIARIERKLEGITA